MSIFEQLFISKYKKILQEIESLNKRNAQGYDSFAEYCFSDEIMIRYFLKLKTIEKKTTAIRVDSYEKFEHNIFKQLEDIYYKKIDEIDEKILKNEYIRIYSKEYYKQKTDRLNNLKKDIFNGYGHKCDKVLDVLIKDIDNRIKEANIKYKEVIENPKKDELQIKHNPEKKEIKYEFPRIELLNNEEEIKEVIQSKEYVESESKIIFGLKEGLNIRIIKLEETSHILIAGTTGIGKTTLLDNIIINILYKSTPDETKLMILDTSSNGLGVYNGIPHLLIPVISDAKRSIGALAWIVKEIENRLKVFFMENVKDFVEYNKKMNNKIKLPRIVIIVDEILDIVSCDKESVDDYLTKITKQGKKAGVFLIVSTNRPSSDIVAGSVKTNIYTRISFFLPSRLDSRLILDMDGAEKINSIGDILYKTIGVTIPKKYHCPFISSNGVKNVVNFLKNIGAFYPVEILEKIENANNPRYELESDIENEEDDPFLMEAIDVVVETGQASTSFIQRKFKVGYARAGRIIDQLENRGIISGYSGCEPRSVLITKEKLKEIKNISKK